MSLSAIILAAGQGTRMKSELPKVAHKILGKPMINYVLDAARGSGADEIVCVVGSGRDKVEPLIEGSKVAIQKKFLGTGDAVKCALEVLSERDSSVIIAYGDCPLIKSDTLAELAKRREHSNASLVISTFEKADPTGYGRIVRDSSLNIVKNVEEKDCDDETRKITECNAGFYCFDAACLRSVIPMIKNNNASKEFYLTDAIEILSSMGRKIEAFQIQDSDELLGVNSQSQLAVASNIMKIRINEYHMNNGITLIDPSTVYISPDVKIASGTEVWPNTIFMGDTSIGRDCVIGPNSRLVDTKVGDGCIVDETIAYESVIEDGANTGPRCYLRPGAHLCKNSKAGTSVEIKKSVVGEGSKVPHLSYIGDTEIGAGVNLGAGTITCNYDGKNKNKTTIGDDTFVGSSTMLVAPVNVGDNVVVGAGSVITDDVPDNTLAFGRARQVNKVGRLEHKNEEGGKRD